MKRFVEEVQAYPLVDDELVFDLGHAPSPADEAALLAEVLQRSLRGEEQVVVTRTATGWQVLSTGMSRDTWRQVVRPRLR